MRENAYFSKTVKPGQSRLVISLFVDIFFTLVVAGISDGYNHSEDDIFTWLNDETHSKERQIGKSIQLWRGQSKFVPALSIQLWLFNIYNMDR